MATTTKSRPKKGRPVRNAKHRSGTVSFREEFGLSRASLARLTGLSERTIATWEAGSGVGDSAVRSLKSIERLLRQLSEVIRKHAIANWLDTPSDGFAGLKPIEVVERGETDRVWRMIFFLGSGMAS